MEELGKFVTTKIENNIYIIAMNSKLHKDNYIGYEAIKELKYHLEEIESNCNILGAILISTKSGSFIAGTTKTLLLKFKSPLRLCTELQKLTQQIEKCSKPIIAAIRGTCSAFGLEIALACHYRIALDSIETKFSFPEITLGLSPCAGATQRMPLLVGLPATLDMMLTGKKVDVTFAKEVDLVDKVVPESKDLKVEAVEFVHKILKKEENIVRNEYTLLKEMYSGNNIFKEAKTAVMKISKGLYPAPLKILEVIRTGINEGVEEGYAAEAEAFAELSSSLQSKGLINLFEAQSKCKENKYEGTLNHEIKTIGIVGVGLMGTGIAKVSLEKGFKTIIKGRNQKKLNQSALVITQYLQKLEDKNNISRNDKEIYLANLKLTLDYKDLKKADIVIEVIAEDLDLKRQVLKKIESVVESHCIIASGTSAISISKIAEDSCRPDKIIGLHYFSPVEKMQLLEIVVIPKTSPDTIAGAKYIGHRQGKTMITVKNNPGFYTTRTLASLMEILLTIIQEGTHPQDLNDIMKNWGFPVGGATLLDEVGHDVNLHIIEDLAKNLGPRHEGNYIAVMREFVKYDILGKKNGKGIFLYEGESRKINPLSMNIFKKYAREACGPKTDNDKLFRMVCCLVNETVLCLEEKIIKNPMEGDVGAVFGLGFPPFTGGPFRWIDSYGADKFVAQMKVFYSAYKDIRYQPAKTLLEMAWDPNKKFYPMTSKL